MLLVLDESFYIGINHYRGIASIYVFVEKFWENRAAKSFEDMSEIVNIMD